MSNPCLSPLWRALLLSSLAAPMTLHAQFNPGPNPITGTVGTAQTLASGTGTVAAGATLDVANTSQSINLSGTATLVNRGTILNSSTGRALRNNNGSTFTITVTNDVGALIQAADADAFQMNQAANSVVLDNFGSIVSLNPSGGGNQAIDWNAITTGGNTLRNHAGGLIRATAADAVRPGANGIIVNAGTIEARPVVEGTAPNRTASGSDGIDTQTRSGVTVTNAGSISGRHGITGGSGSAAITITVTNEAGGSITGVNGSGINIDNAASVATIVNRGAIVGRFDWARFDVGDGDGIDVDGIAHIDNAGVIRGIGAGGNGSDGQPNNAEGISIGGGRIVNRVGAEITSENPAASGTAARGNGILVDNSSGGNAFAATELINDGLVRGVTGYAFKAIGNFADRIVNGVTGLLRGGGSDAAVQTGGGDDVVVNAGRIQGDGGKAIDLGAGDDTLHVVGPQAAIVGDVHGGTGRNTLVFDIGAGHRFAYDGVLSAFDVVRIASGTTVLSGIGTALGTTTVEAGATLGGDGAVGGKVVVAAGGMLAPGEGGRIGTFGVGALDLEADGVLAIDVHGAAGLADRLVIDGEARLFGRLLVTLLSAPTVGDAFEILTAGGPLVGAFGSGAWVDAWFDDVAYRFAVVFDDGRVVLTAVPEPSMAAIVALALALLAGVRSRAGRQRPRAGG